MSGFITEKKKANKTLAGPGRSRGLRAKKGINACSAEAEHVSARALSTLHQESTLSTDDALAATLRGLVKRQVARYYRWLTAH